MITIEELADRLLDKSSLEFNKFDWRPVRCDKYEVPVFSIIESKAPGASAKLKNKLSKVLAFVDSVSHKRYSEGCTKMPISSTNRDYLLIWGSQRNVSNAIEFMKEIGLIEVDKDKYQFGAYYDKDNKSKIYKYFKENEDKLVQFCNERNIEKFKIRNVKRDNNIYTIVETCKDKSFNDSEVLFKTNLNLVKPNGVSVDDFEKYLTECLFKNYPSLLNTMNKLDEINEKYYCIYPEFRIRFKPKFTWDKENKKVTCIGIRATNSLCNTKKEDRDAVLNKYYFNQAKDVKSSVPRITLSLNSGRWVDEEYDVYELISKQMDPDVEFDVKRRNAIKNLFMRCYFDGSNKQLGHHTWLAIDRSGLKREDVYETINKLREAASIVMKNKFYGNEIFYIESLLYVETLIALLENHQMTWLLYDSFYSCGPETNDVFEFTIREGIKRTFNNNLYRYLRELHF